MRLFIFLCLLIPFAAFSKGTKQITLDDIFKNNTFKQDFVAGFRSMKDGIHYSEINENGDLQVVNFSEGKVEKTLVNLKKIKYQDSILKIDDYVFSSDENLLLLLTESENIYRRSILYKVFIYDLNKATLTLLNDKKILHPSFSPQGDKVAFVKENNLYYYDIPSEETIAITEGGQYNLIYGNCDWVYEEEFEFTKAYEWSPKGDFIAYYEFDQTLVPEYTFALYDKLYPTDYKYKYPKAGEKNSVIGIYCYDLKKEKSVACDLGEEKDIYIPRIKMNPFDNSLVIYRLNRLQNHLELLKANSKTGQTEIIFEENNEKYIQINDQIIFLKNENAFIYTSEKNGFNHIYKYTISTQQIKQLTSGNWDVVSLSGYNESTQEAIFVSAESSPMERMTYAVSVSSLEKRTITKGRGFHQVDWSNQFKFYMDKFSTATEVPVYAIFDENGNLIRKMKDNQKFKEAIAEFDWSPLEFIEVPNEEGTLLNGWIIKPSNFNPTTKHPLLMFQYSGPGSQQVLNQFGGRDFWWYQMLAQQGYVIICFDGTGTGCRGEAFKKKTYLQLGKYESDDQIAIAKYFAKQKYIDPSRIGIWGWSYGGYMSSICITKGADVFKTAIAVAPVTNCRYYDNIYTERYMRSPNENAKGYDENSPINMVDKLKGNYLLIHGSADDNVHYQNSMMMIDKMIKANKEFDSEIYPNKNHGISGGITRYQLYNRITNFIVEKL